MTDKKSPRSSYDDGLAMWQKEAAQMAELLGRILPLLQLDEPLSPGTVAALRVRIEKHLAQYRRALLPRSLSTGDTLDAADAALTPQQLKNVFDPEHPYFTRRVWVLDAQAGRTVDGYWSYVHTRIAAGVALTAPTRDMEF